MSTVPLEPASHEESAQSLLAQLRTLARTVPGYTHITSEHRRRLIPYASLPDEFLLAIAVACDAHVPLAEGASLTGAEVRELISYRRSYTGVQDDMAVHGRGVADAIMVRSADVGQRALRVYNNAKRLNRDLGGELLVPHIEAMKRALKSTSRKPAPPPAAPEPPKPE